MTRVVELGRCGGERVQLATMVDADTAAKVRQYAAEDGRSVSNALARLIEKALADQPVSGAGWEQAEVRCG